MVHPTGNLAVVVWPGQPALQRLGPRQDWLGGSETTHSRALYTRPIGQTGGASPTWSGWGSPPGAAPAGSCGFSECLHVLSFPQNSQPWLTSEKSSNGRQGSRATSWLWTWGATSTLYSLPMLWKDDWHEASGPSVWGTFPAAASPQSLSPVWQGLHQIFSRGDI